MIVGVLTHMAKKQIIKKGDQFHQEVIKKPSVLGRKVSISNTITKKPAYKTQQKVHKELAGVLMWPLPLKRGSTCSIADQQDYDPTSHIQGAVL